MGSLLCGCDKRKQELLSWTYPVPNISDPMVVNTVSSPHLRQAAAPGTSRPLPLALPHRWSSLQRTSGEIFITHTAFWCKGKREELAFRKWLQMSLPAEWGQCLLSASKLQSDSPLFRNAVPASMETKCPKNCLVNCGFPLFRRKRAMFQMGKMYLFSGALLNHQRFRPSQSSKTALVHCSRIASEMACDRPCS